MAQFWFSVDKSANGYLLELRTGKEYGESEQYVFERLSKLRKAIKEVLDLENPTKETA